MAQGPRWRRTSFGYYVPAGATDAELHSSPTQRILDVVPLVPTGGAITSWAAAFVQGVDALDGLDPRSMQPLPVVVYTPRNPGRLSSPGVTYLRGRLLPDRVREELGIPVVEPLTATLDAARLAESLEEAVAAVDTVTHAGLISLADLERFIAERPGRRGVQQARRAVALADAAARSPGESRLRVSYQLDAGLPRPRVNVPIFDLEENLLGIGDLLDEDAGFLTEFDGALHRERPKHHADNVREERLEGANLTVVRTDTMDLRSDRRELVARLRSGWRRGHERDRTRDRWTLVEPEWWLAQQDPFLLLSEEEQRALWE
jgi:hypothetical protein